MCYAARIALTYLKLASPVFTILMAGVWHVLERDRIEAVTYLVTKLR
jgi:hypothetical protein